MARVYIRSPSSCEMWWIVFGNRAWSPCNRRSLVNRGRDNWKSRKKTNKQKPYFFLCTPLARNYTVPFFNFLWLLEGHHRDAGRGDARRPSEDSCLKYFIYSAGRYYGPENQPVPGETGTHAFSSPPPSTLKTGKKRRSSWSSSAAADSNLSPTARCHVLSVILGDGLYTRPRRPGRARITTRAHKTHTHKHIYICVHQTWSVGCLGFLRRFRLFLRFRVYIAPLSRHPAVPYTYCSRLKVLRPPESSAKSLRAFYPQSRVYVFAFRNSSSYHTPPPPISPGTRPQRQRGTTTG